jgi:hypothetical protein
MLKKIHVINVSENCPADAMENIFDDIDSYLSDEKEQCFKILGHGVTVKTIELEEGSQFYIVRGDFDILDEEEYLIKDIVQ